MGEERYNRVRVTAIKRETHDTSSFTLEPLDEPIHAKAGQFLTFVLTSHTGRELRRSYSLSSSPENNEPLTVTVKRVPNGEVSRWLLYRVSVGESLYSAGASGMFLLPQQPERYNTFIFFAAGSGITPVFSLIKTLLAKSASTKAILVYSNRNLAETIFYAELKKLQEENATRFEINFLFSMSGELNKSRLTPVLLENFLLPFRSMFKGIMFYLCGPTDYMRMIYFTLMSMGIIAAQVKREIFLVPQQPVIAVPDDTREHSVTLLTGENRYVFPVQYPVSILKRARSLNIPLTFSCETGQCGTCVATCLQGEVWMSRNEVLLDEQLEEGMILTCTGYPVHGNVVIKI